MIYGTAHTGITVASLEDAIHFWVDVLGFKVASEATFEASEFLDNVVGVQGAAIKLAVIETPGHKIELLEYSAPADREVVRPRSCDVGSFHVAFIVDDIEAVISRVADADWRPLGVIQTVQSGVRAGLRLMYVRGHDGITVEFLQPAYQGGPL